MANGVTADPDETTLTSESPIVPSNPNDAPPPQADPGYAANYPEQPTTFAKPPTRAEIEPHPPRYTEGQRAVPLSSGEVAQRQTDRYQGKLDRWNAQQMYEGQQAQLREINRQSALTFKQQGVATERNPETGMIEPTRDDSGNLVYHPGKGPVQYDESGKPFQVQRTTGGPQVKQLDTDAPIDTHPDRPNELYKQNKYSPWEYLGTVQEGLQSSDKDIQGAAQDAQLKLDKRLHAAVGNDLGRVVAQKALDVQNRVADFRENSAQLKEASDALATFDQDHPGLNEKTHIFGGLTSQAQALQDQKKQLSDQVDHLSGKGYSPLDPDKNAANYDKAEKAFTAAERKIVGEHGQDLKAWRETAPKEPGDLDQMLEERRAGLVSAGKDPNDDPIFQSLENRKAELGIGQAGQPAQDAQEAELRAHPITAPLMQERDQLEADHQAANGQLDQLEADYKKRLDPIEQELNARQNQIAPLRAEVEALNNRLSQIDTSTPSGYARAQTILNTLNPMAAELQQREGGLAQVQEAHAGLIDEANQGWQTAHDQLEAQLAPRRQDWQNRMDTAVAAKQATDHVRDTITSDTPTREDRLGKPAFSYDQYQEALKPENHPEFNPRNEQIRAEPKPGLAEWMSSPLVASLGGLYHVSQIVDSLFAPGGAGPGHPLVPQDVAEAGTRFAMAPARAVAAGLEKVTGKPLEKAEKGAEASFSKMFSGFSSLENLASLPVFAVPGVAQVWAAGVMAKLPDQFGQVKDAIQQHGIFSKQAAQSLAENGIYDAMTFLAMKGTEAAKIVEEQVVGKPDTIDLINKAKRDPAIRKSPEFASLFGGIDPEIAGTTPEKVAAFAKTLGMDYRPVPKPAAEAAAPDIGAVHDEIDNLQMEGKTPEEHVETQNALRGMVKIAQGEPMDSLTTVEKRAVLAKDENGLPRVEVVKGNPVITDAALQRVQQIAPITSQIMPQDEESQRQAIVHPEEAPSKQAEAPSKTEIAAETPSGQQPTFAVEVQNAKGETEVKEVQAASEQEAHAKVAQTIEPGQGLIRDVTMTHEPAPPPEQLADTAVRQISEEAGRTLQPEEEQAVRGLADKFAPAVSRWQQAFNDLRVTAKDYGSMGGVLDKDSNLILSLPDIVRHAQELGTDEAPDVLIRHEAIHAVTKELTAQGKIDPVGMYEELPDEVKQYVAGVYKPGVEARDTFEDAHEFVRMMVEHKLAIEDGDLKDAAGHTVTEDLSPTFISRIRDMLAKLFGVFRDLAGRLKKMGASDETIADVAKTRDLVVERLKQVDAERRGALIAKREATPEAAARPERPVAGAEKGIEPEGSGREAALPVTPSGVGPRGEPAPTGAEVPARTLEPTARAELAQNLNVPHGAIGNATQVTQGDRTLNVAYVAQEAAQSQTSHDAQGRVNPEYDQSLQPRDRSLPVYRQQSQSIARNLDFDKSAFFPNTKIPATTADLGAPIMTPAGHTIVGNGREIGINSAYNVKAWANQPGAPWNIYRENFIRNARKFGIDPAAVRAMKQPILKRVILDEVPKEDLVRFSQESNEPVAMGSNAIETARRDASRLTPEHLSLLNPNYELSSAKNAPFMRAYLKDVVRGALGPNEANLTSVELSNRVRSAIFTHAYGVDEAGRAAIERLAGEADPSGKTITNGLLTVAPIIARMRADIKTGDLHPDMDIAPAVTRAAQDIATTLQNKPVAQPAKQALDGLYQQRNLVEEEPLSRSVLDFLLRNRTKRANIEQGLSNFVEAVYALGNPKQVEMFTEGGIVTPLEVFKAATSDKAIARKEDQRVLAAQQLKLHLQGEVDGRLLKIFGRDHEYDLMGLPKMPETLPANHRLLTPTDQLTKATVTADSKLNKLGILPVGIHDRAEMHIAIARYFLQGGTLKGRGPMPETQMIPEMLMMGGGGGAGKTSSLALARKLTGEPPGGAVTVNSDDIRELLPEYEAIKAAGDGRAAHVTQEEATKINDRLIDLAQRRRVNIVLDGTMKTPSNAFKMRDAAIAQGYEVKMIGVTIDPYEAAVRASIRASKTGRWVPRVVIFGAHKGFNAGTKDVVRTFGANNVWLFDNTGSKTVRIPVDDVMSGRYKEVDERSKINPKAETREELYRTAGGLAEPSVAGRVPARREAGRPIGRPEPQAVQQAFEVLKSQPLNDQGEKIVSPAVQWENGQVEPVTFHYQYPDAKPGFTTTLGRFLDREEAYKLAKTYAPSVVRASGGLETWQAKIAGAIQTLRSQQTLDLFDDYAKNLPPAAKVSKPALKEQVKKDVPALSGNEIALQDLFDLAQNKTTAPPTKVATLGVKYPSGIRTVEDREKAERSWKLSNLVENRLHENVKLDSPELFGMADTIYGGTQAKGTYTPKDAYDAVEMAVNRITRYNKEFSPQTPNPEFAIRNLKHLISKIPTQTKRTAETDEFQQFSTVPPLAFVANWVADVGPKDVVLEPSAGVGGLIAFAKNAGAKVVANELSPRRAALLERTGLSDQVYTENAEQIHNILPQNVQPNLVIMNPPFSSTAGRMQGTRDTSNAIKHVEQALNRLQPGGRLVMIVGEGMGLDRPSFKAFWDKIRQNYNLRANVQINGSEYAKYGTTWDNQIVVIDKFGEGGVVPGEKRLSPEPISGRVERVEDLIPLLEGVKNDRPESIGSLEGQRGPAPRSPEQDIGAGRPGLAPRADVNIRGGRPATEQPGMAPAHPQGERPARGGEVDTGLAERQGAGIEPQGERAGRGERPVSEPHRLDRGALTDAIFDSYEPSVRLPGTTMPPIEVQESSAMASVEPVAPTYVTSIPPQFYQPRAGENEARLSAIAMESVIRAGQQHQQMIPVAYTNEERQNFEREHGVGATPPEQVRGGFFIGDGTGLGKGRQVMGIILDNWLQGREKHVWVSHDRPLINDAKRDAKDVANMHDKIFDVGKVKMSDPIPHKNGIAFITYSTLRSEERNVEPGRQPATRIRQLADWFGRDFDGVIAFDESHDMANNVATRGKRGLTDPAAQALAGLELQRLLPNARVVYLSATGATEVSNLGYGERLGLWGPGTPFANKEDFISKVGSSGVAGMELVARDMKALGKYTARSISWKGVTYDNIEHPLTPEQRQVYDTLAEAWQGVLARIDDALEVVGGIVRDPATGESRTVDPRAKSSALSAFWGAHQRFFNQVITSMKMPSVLNASDDHLKQNKSVVMQLVNTNEATQNRAIDKIRADAAENGDEADFEDLDMTPRDILMQMVERSFPVTQLEQYTDAEGNIKSRPARDSQGNLVINQDAVRMRDELLDRLGSIRVPDGPLEMVLNHFGKDKVSEVTGRTQRVVWSKDKQTAEMKRVVERRSKLDATKEVSEFQDGKRHVLVFSAAGNTGKSYHADLRARNQEKRVHILVQPGWRASSAVQGFGRTHRNNQKQPPHYQLATSDIVGEKRFMSSIARRLDQLGALTKGQRQTASQGFFKSRDNLESPEARTAMTWFYRDALNGAIPEVPAERLEREMGLKMRDRDGNVLAELPATTQFLNRLLSLKLDTQRAVFDAFSDRLDRVIEHAIQTGTLDQGVENLTALSTKAAEDRVIHTDPRTGAQTRYVKLELTNPNEKLEFPEAGGEFYKNNQSGRVYLRGKDHTITDTQTGALIDQSQMQGITGRHWVEAQHLSNADRWTKLDKGEARSLWNEQHEKTPANKTDTVHFITGTILPVWDRLNPGDNAMQVKRVQTDEGHRMIGMVIRLGDLADVMKNFGQTPEAAKIDSKTAARQVLDDGAVARLANGWRIKRSRVAGENRIELVGPDISNHAELDTAGLFRERISFTTRYFVPVDRAASVIGKLTENRPIVELNAPSNQGALAAQQITGDHNASRITSTTGVGVRGQGQGVGQEAPLRQSGQTAEIQKGAVRPEHLAAQTVKDAITYQGKQPRDYDKSSTQVTLPKSDAKPFTDFAKSIPANEIYTDPDDPTFGREDEPHITALYGITQAAPIDTARAVIPNGPVQATVGKLSIFKSDKYDVLKADINSPDLHRINDALKKSVPFESDFPKHTPHLTIAYLKKGEGQKYVGDTRFEGTPLSFNSLDFRSKDGRKFSINLGGRELAAQPTQVGNVYFVRHGTTTFNAETGQSPDRIRGHINVPLNANGARQAVQVGKDLKGKGITKIYTSDLSRAATTAGHIAQQIGIPLQHVVTLYGLRPWNFGPTIEGKPTSEVMPKIRHLTEHPDEVPKGGESFNQFKARYGGTVERIKADNPDENIAIVTHYRGLKLSKSMDAAGNVDINEFTKKDDTIPPGSYQVEGGQAPTDLRSQALTDADKTPRQRFEENLPLANRIAGSFSNIPGVERGDIQSRARTALLRASRAFDPARGIPFNRLASVSISNDLKRFYGEQRGIPEITTLEAPLTEAGLTAKDLVRAPTDVRSEVQAAETHRVLTKAISELPARMQETLGRVLDGETFPEIAKAMGVSKQGAQQLAVAAMKRLRPKLSELGIKGTHDLFSQVVDDSVKQADTDDPMGALMDLLKRDPLEQIRGFAKGRPDLALGTIGPEMEAVHQFHTETATPQKFEQWEKQADQIIAKRGKAWGNEIVKRWTDGGFLEPAEVRATQKYLIARQGEAKTLAEQREYDAAAYAYTKIGEAVARQMASRRDPFKTPEERNRDFLAKAISWVNKGEQRELDGIKDKTAKVSRLQDMVAERRRQIGLSLEYLTGKGVTLDDILSGGTELRLVGAKMIDNQMKEYSSAEQKALKLAQKGERSPAEIAKATGLTEKAVRDLNDAFISDLEKSLMPKTLAGVTVENLDPMLLAQPTEGKPTISEEAARSEARKIIKAMGFVPSKDLGKFRVSKRKSKPRIFIPPQKAGPPVEPPAPSELPTGRERQAPLVPPEPPTGTPPAPGAVPYPQPAAAPYTGRVLGQPGLPLYPEMMIRKGADLESPTDVSRLGRIIGAAANGNRFDMLYEAWLANILSGPTTHLSYKLALAANLGMEVSLQRGVEALVNLATRDPKSAQIGEFPYIIKGLTGALSRAVGLGARQFGAESELLSDEVLNQQVEAFEGPGRKFFSPAISERPFTQLTAAGTKTPLARALTGAGESIDNQLARLGKFNPVRGRVIRMPLRVLYFVQGFYASLAHSLNVGAFAYRQAKAEGLSGDQLSNRINELVATPGSAPHQKAVDLAEQMTFRQPIKTREQGGNMIENLVAQFIRARSGSHLLGSQMPFVELPYNLFKTGLRKTPFGAANLLSRVGEAGFFKLKDGKPFFESYAKADFNKHMAEQLIAWTVAAILWNMAWGDDDDGEKPIVVTGGIPTSTDMADMRKSVRELYERAYGGPTQIIIGGRNGLHFNYGKYEPVATVLGTVVNTIHQMKHLVRGEQGVGDTLSGIWSYSVAQAEEKTFLRGLSRMLDSLRHPSQAGGNIRELIMSALVPNLIRQPLRNIDDYIRDYRTAPALYSSLPTGALAQPKIDVYGKPVQKQGNWFTRMFVQAGVKPDPVLEKSDQLTLKYNLHHPQTPYAPSVPLKKYKDANGKDVDMTPEQGTKFQVAVGKRFSTLLRGQITQHQVDHPTEDDIKKIREIHTRAMEEVKSQMFPKRSAPKVSQINQVREMMRAA